MASISKTKEYKALAERIREAFRQDRGFAPRTQRAVRYMADVKAGREKWSAEKASGLLRVANTLYDKRNKNPEAVAARRAEKEQSIANELIDVFGTSGDRTLYTIENDKDRFSALVKYRGELYKERADALAAWQEG